MKKPARILLIDSNNTFKEATVLTQESFETRVTQNGRGCLQQFESWQPDLLITDIEMPMVTGFEVARAARQFDRGSKIIFLTAGFDCKKCENIYKMEFAKDSNCKLLLKPFKPEILIQLIEFMLYDKLNP